MVLVAFTASSSPSSTAPTWVAVIGTVSAIITATGVIIAGVFAYFKFSKGRTFHPRCFIDINSKLTEIGGNRALQVTVTVRNDGLIALLFPSDIPQRLIVGQADSVIWDKACERMWPVVWEKSSIRKGQYNLAVPEGNSLEVRTTTEIQLPSWWQWLSPRWLRQHLRGYLRGETLEPGELWVRSTLVPVSSEGVAYLLRARICACRHVGVRHVLRHQRRCYKMQAPEMIWIRDVYLMPGSDNHVHSANEATRTPKS